VFGAAGVLVAFASMVVNPITRSFAFVVVTDADQAVPVAVALPVASTGDVVAMPVNEAAAMSPWTTGPENVAVRTIPDASPDGAGADAIATRLLFPAAFCCRSTVQVSPPPLTDVSVLVE